MVKMSYEDRWNLARNALALLLGVTVKAVADKYGSEGVAAIEEAWKDARMKAAPLMAEKLGVKENDCRGVAKIVNYADSLYGAEGGWKDLTPRRGIKIVKDCPMAKHLSREVCNVCFRGAVTGIGIGLTGNRNFRCSIPKSIAAGDEVCEIIIENM